MRNPLRKLSYWLGLLVVSGALLFVGVQQFERVGETGLSISLVVAGLSLASLSLAGLIYSAQSAVGQAKLLSRRGLIASWHVSAAEWNAFRETNARRSDEGAEHLNELWIRRETPERGIEVLVGERSLIVDKSFHALSPIGNPSVTQVSWISTSPACLEFTLLYLRSSGSLGDGTPFLRAKPISLRVPVPAAARQSGAKVLNHYAEQIRNARARSERSWPKIRLMLLIGLVVGTTLAVAAILLTS